MSFILDALRKSEHARQRLGGATLAELPLGRRPRSQPWWVIALAVLLVVNLVVLSFVLFRPNETQRVAESIAPAQVVAPAKATPPPAPSLAEEAVAPNVEYETIPREASPLAQPVGEPRLVRPIEPATNALPPVESSDGLPELRLDMHVYAPVPKDRFVFINMHKYVEGQTLAEGPRLREITRDGVVLEYRGEQLHLGWP